MPQYRSWIGYTPLKFAVNSLLQHCPLGGGLLIACWSIAAAVGEWSRMWHSGCWIPFAALPLTAAPPAQRETLLRFAEVSARSRGVDGAHVCRTAAAGAAGGSCPESRGSKMRLERCIAATAPPLSILRSRLLEGKWCACRTRPSRDFLR